MDIFADPLGGHFRWTSTRVVFRVVGAERGREYPDHVDDREDRTASLGTERGLHQRSTDGARSRAGRRPKPYPERIDASPEEIADAVLSFTPLGQWEYVEQWRRKVGEDRVRLDRERHNRSESTGGN